MTPIDALVAFALVAALFALFAGFTPTATGNVNNFRYRYGETNPKSLPFCQLANNAPEVSIGDLCFQAVTGSIANTLMPAGAFPIQAAVATATAPVLTDGGIATATAFTNASTHVKVSYVFPWGEGVLSAATAVTPTAHAMILLGGVALPAPAIGLNVYVETSAGSGTYELWNSVQGNGQGIVGDTFIAGYGKGQAPPASPQASNIRTVSQYYFAQQFVGVAAQAFDGTIAVGGNQGQNAFGIRDGQLRYDSDGTFEFVAPSGTFTPGQYVGVCGNLLVTTDTALLPQQVCVVVHSTLAIGMVDNVVSVANTLVKVKINTKNLNLNAATANAIV